MKTRTLLLAVVAIALGAVAYFTLREPPTEKAARLRQEMTVACWDVEKPNRVPTSQDFAECDVARRKYNKFMN